MAKSTGRVRIDDLRGDAGKRLTDEAIGRITGGLSQELFFDTYEEASRIVGTYKVPDVTLKRGTF